MLCQIKIRILAQGKVFVFINHGCMKNTTGTRVGQGGRDRKLVLKIFENPQKYSLFYLGTPPPVAPANCSNNNTVITVVMTY